MRIYRINEFVSELETDLLANQVQNSQDNTCIIDPRTGECPNVAYPTAGTIGEYFGTLQQSVVEAWRSHLKTNKYSDHMALDEFYKEMPEKVDALVEAYMGKYGKVEEEYKNVMWENMEITVYLEMLRVFTSNGSKLFFTEADTELFSLVDDILGQIDATLYKLKELKESLNIPWNMANEIGYEPKTTFWEDFTIADRFGEKAVKDTYERAFEEWKDHYEYLTELVMVLNHKIWEHYNRKDMGLARLYDILYKKTDEYAVNNLKGKELSYFYATTD